MGSLIIWQPHIHVLTTDGAYRDDGPFAPLSFRYLEDLAEAFRSVVLASIESAKSFQGNRYLERCPRSTVRVTVRRT